MRLEGRSVRGREAENRHGPHVLPQVSRLSRVLGLPRALVALQAAQRACSLGLPQGEGSTIRRPLPGPQQGLGHKG